MSAPRHLWSDDWQLESSAHGEDLAARRDATRPRPDPEPQPEPEPDGGRRALLSAVRNWTRRHVRVAVLAVIVTLLVAAAAYAVTSELSGSNTRQPAAATGSKPWLGVDLGSAPIPGVLVTSVIPGSPAAAAGIRPGDVITQLDTEPIVAPAVFVSAIAGMQPGDTVAIQFQRGSSQYTADVVLASRPAHIP